MTDNTIRLSRSVIGNAEKQAVMDVLNKGYLGMGENVQLFEEQLSRFFGRPAVCVNSGTAALHLALQSLGIGRGDEVLVQSVTFLASFQAISATGARPVACDIDPDTITLDVTDAKKRITDKTKVIMPVHYASGMGALEEIYDLANDNDLRVVEDAAHALGCTYNGRKTGSFGDIACFSFDGIKNITSGEGGAIVTKDMDVLQKARDARLLGIEKDTQKRYSNQRSWDFDVSAQGWRYHMSNIMAAIGIEQLNRFPEFAECRRQLAKHYHKKLEHLDSVELLNQDLDSIIPHIFVIKLKNADRDDIRKKMLERGIQTGIHYKPNHYLSLYNSDNTFLPVTDRIVSQLLTLPLHPKLGEQDIDYICQQLVECLREQ
ncbi:MAG: DegT/DnrJ/EryC1/StrS family aminotransferase [Methanosarcinaceae archaeon]|nr:DegT/DnrJ/EryC1/StrS family aminotransferase [Methanosarcinaceae archaeon]